MFDARCGLRRHAVSVCMSVRPSAVMFVYSGRTSNRILKLFCTIGQPQHSSFFPYQTLWEYSDGYDGPLTGASNAGGMKKIAIFHQYLALSQKWYNIRPYRMRIGNRTKAFKRYHFQWPWVNPNPDVKVTILFNVNNSKIVQDRAILTTADQ